MRSRLLIATMLAAALAAWDATAASARDAIPIHTGGSSTPLRLGALTGSATSGSATSFTQIPVRLRGTLAVQFHGDQATGCAARGLCGFSGTVIWQPPSTGTVDVDTFRDQGRTAYDVSLDLSAQEFTVGPPVNGGTTTADVRFAPNGSAGSASICTDATATGSNIEMPVRFRAAALSLAAASPSILGTRCAGPLQSDVASVLARRVVDVATLSHGRTGVSLASSADFAVHGLSGTVTSTIQLSLGRPRTDHFLDNGSSSDQSGFRTVAVSYRAHLDGSVLTHIHGDPSSCAPLGSCGANGTFALREHSTPGMLVLGTVTRKRRPLRDALTALGLRKHGNPRGIQVFGIFFVRGPATYAVDVTQGAATCTDTAPGAVGAVVLGVTHGRLQAEFGSAQDAPHLRCPGPIAASGNGFASGTASLGALAPHGGTIHLRTGGKLEDDGYVGRSAPNLALTFSRPKLKISTDALRSPNPG
jgi:hypothetical protein